MRNSVLIIFMLAARSLSGQPALELAGHWQGAGRISSDWCTQDTLAFHFSISTDDEFFGTVGDATIISGTIQATGTDSYQIVLKLKGSLIECENIRRTKLIMDVKRTDNLLTGTFYTEGFFPGKKENGILQGFDLRLSYK